MKVVTYLFLNGRCEEALDFYRDALGAEVAFLVRFKDSPEPETAAPPPKVPTQQDKIVESEKAAVRNLQRQLDQDASRREEIIEKERERLAGALEQLQKTPLSEFGSQKNKTRAMGYYKYRLEALQDSPDRYFSYGESDID